MISDEILIKYEFSKDWHDEWYFNRSDTDGCLMREKDFRTSESMDLYWVADSGFIIMSGPIKNEYMLRKLVQLIK